MKISTSWLRDWIDAPWDARELGARLTMAGFELEAIEPAAPDISGVVVAEILSVERHPQADKLHVCGVSVGSGEPLQIVCGAPNARAGLKSALATVGAQLPGGLAIKAARLRGVESRGMLASAKELGLSDDSAGILELPADAPVGADLRRYLDLDDPLLELNVTPNRGDAMSVLGVAREVAALAGRTLKNPLGPAVAPRHDATFPVILDEPRACPKFVGRVIRGVDNRARTPQWMRERLRRAGQRSISPLVDVTNYVLLELGQPLHAYDLGKLDRGIRVRFARAGESCELLDGRTVEPDDTVLVISDSTGPVGLAGIMGGARTAVSDDTTDVFLEVAWFAPEAIAGRSRRFGLQTDAGQRFERGVDPMKQERAVERATTLILEIAGGLPGPTIVTQDEDCLPARWPVRVRRAQIARLLGARIPDHEVERALRSLDMQVEPLEEGWRVVPPSHRFDIAIEADLIEEVARIVGLDAIPETPALTPQAIRPVPEARPPELAVLETLAVRGYHETINFSFVDPQLQERLFPGVAAKALANPIASDLSVMRVSLWPGLIKRALENRHRQHDRIRLFEHGSRFVLEAGEVREVDSLAAIALGPRLPEQWGTKSEAVDFFDVKGDLEALCAATGEPDAFSFEPAELPCLHPGRAARVLRSGATVGWIGELHPEIVRALDLTYGTIVFEIDFHATTQSALPVFHEISRFPQVRRDLAFTIEESVPFSRVRERVTCASSSLLRDLRIFDVYRGAGVEKGRKSVALGLIFQENSRTLTDEEVDRAMAAIRADLTAALDARIRE
jgi:phenylalanyl-tRNA synthetase beta chain